MQLIRLFTMPLYISKSAIQISAGWHVVTIRASHSRSRWIAVLRIIAAGGDVYRREILFSKPTLLRVWGLKFGVAYFDRDLYDLSVRLYGHSSPQAEIALSLRSLPRTLAAFGVCFQNLTHFRKTFMATSGSVRTKTRRALAQSAMNGQHILSSYQQWIRMFDYWPADRINRIGQRVVELKVPNIDAVVFHATNRQLPLNETLSSLRQQYYQPRLIVTVTGSISKQLPVNIRQLDDGYVALLQAGEVLPPHALLILAHEVVRLHYPVILLADEDQVLKNGKRANPHFKPAPNATLMYSGTLSRGVWLIRRDFLSRISHGALDWAECVRLEAWVRAYEEGQQAKTFRIPYLLTHRRFDAENAPGSALATVILAHFERMGVPVRIEPHFPIQVRREVESLKSEKVSIVIPSLLRKPETTDCMTTVMKETEHANIEVLVLVTQATGLDEEQELSAARLKTDGRLRIKLLNRSSFNYSLANNVAAQETDGRFICLLNDDVSPLDSTWLDQMLCFFVDPKVGVVGAKLYYPASTVQHGGVIMGLAGLCEHANRYLPKDCPGYAWRALLDQEMSAVTGACLLVRRDVFEAVGGLDEELATSFNDIDFCMRVRGAGYSIVFAASVELLHYETLSFGHHHFDDMARERRDIALMRQRWEPVIRDDPFHNPNLSLVPGSEWTLAYPPRIDDDLD
jgi:GT2 family glycosyltransferase